MASFLEKNERRSHAEGEVCGANKEPKSLQNRDGGKYDRKSFRITMPIVRRQSQIIVEEMSFFTFSYNTRKPRIKNGG